MVKLWTPQELYDEARDLGFSGYPPAAEVEAAAYAAGDGDRGIRCLLLAEQLAHKQQYQIKHVERKPVGKLIRKRFTGNHAG